MSSANRQIEEETKGPSLPAHEDGNGTDLPVILSFLFDKPNIITLLGLSIGVLAIYFSLVQNFPAAIIALLWAVLMDWFDGLAARRMQGRSESQKLFGGQMDSLVDLVVSAAAPAILLLSVGGFSPWFYPGALVIVMAGVLRLSYYGVFGLDENGTHAGLTIDNTPLVVSALFLFYTLIDHHIFAVVLYVAILVMSFLHVAPFRMGKLGGRWYYAVTAYVMIMTGLYTFIIWTQ